MSFFTSFFAALTAGWVLLGIVAAAQALTDEEFRKEISEEKFLLTLFVLFVLGLGPIAFGFSLAEMSKEISRRRKAE